MLLHSRYIKREYSGTKTDHWRGLQATFSIKLWCKMDITLVKISPTPSKFSKIMSTKEFFKTFSSQILFKCKHCYFLYLDPLGSLAQGGLGQYLSEATKWFFNTLVFRPMFTETNLIIKQTHSLLRYLVKNIKWHKIQNSLTTFLDIFSPHSSPDITGDSACDCDCVLNDAVSIIPRGRDANISGQLSYTCSLSQTDVRGLELALECLFCDHQYPSLISHSSSKITSVIVIILNPLGISNAMKMQIE